jgi:hypothetical protein
VNSEQFAEIFSRQFRMADEVLNKKAREYATDEDRLHNFKSAAALIGGTPEQALWGFAVKHLVSISDMVASDEAYSQEAWDEKIGDALNYLILLRAQVFERATQIGDGLMANPTTVYPKAAFVDPASNQRA